MKNICEKFKNLKENKRIKKENAEMYKNFEAMGIADYLKIYKNSSEEYSKRRFLDNKLFSDGITPVWKSEFYGLAKMALKEELLEKYSIESITCAIAMVSNELAGCASVAWGLGASKNAPFRAQYNFISRIYGFDVNDTNYEKIERESTQAYEELMNLCNSKG